MVNKIQSGVYRLARGEDEKQENKQRSQSHADCDKCCFMKGKKPSLMTLSDIWVKLWVAGGSQAPANLQAELSSQWTWGANRLQRKRAWHVLQVNARAGNKGSRAQHLVSLWNIVLKQCVLHPSNHNPFVFQKQNQENMVQFFCIVYTRNSLVSF